MPSSLPPSQHRSPGSNFHIVNNLHLKKPYSSHSSRRLKPLGPDTSQYQYHSNQKYHPMHFKDERVSRASHPRSSHSRRRHDKVLRRMRRRRTMPSIKHGEERVLNLDKDSPWKKSDGDVAESMGKDDPSHDEEMTQIYETKSSSYTARHESHLKARHTPSPSQFMKIKHVDYKTPTMSSKLQTKPRKRMRPDRHQRKQHSKGSDPNSKYESNDTAHMSSLVPQHILRQETDRIVRSLCDIISSELLSRRSCPPKTHRILSRRLNQLIQTHHSVEQQLQEHEQYSRRKQEQLQEALRMRDRELGELREQYTEMKDHVEEEIGYFGKWIIEEKGKLKEVLRRCDGKPST